MKKYILSLMLLGLCNSFLYSMVITKSDNKEIDFYKFCEDFMAKLIQHKDEWKDYPQSYKLIQRFELFDDLSQKGGIIGFPGTFDTLLCLQDFVFAWCGDKRSLSKINSVCEVLGLDKTIERESA